MFGKKKQKETYDPAREKPVLHKSICTGETAAGFQDLSTGKFREAALVRSDADLKAFMKEYGLSEKPETVY